MNNNYEAEKQRRISLIRDTLNGIVYQLPDPEVLLYPFLDCVMLLHQRALVPAVWKQGKCCGEPPRVSWRLFGLS